MTPIFDKLLEYKRSWIQHVNRMPRNRLPRVRKYYSPTGRKNHGGPLKRLLDTWDRNGSTSDPTSWQIYHDDDDDDDVKIKSTLVHALGLWIGRTAHRGSRGIALLFLDHGTRSRWGFSVMPRLHFTPRKDPVPIVQKAGWASGSV